MKKIFSILMIVSVMSMVLSGCGKKEEAAPADAPAAATDAPATE